MENKKMNRQEFSHWFNKIAQEQSHKAGISVYKAKQTILNYLRKKAQSQK